MGLGVRQKRTAIAARSLSYAIVAVTVGLVAITTAFYSQGALSANPNAHSSSSSLLSSSSVLSSSSSAAQPAAQASTSLYPLVWGPNPPGVSDPGTFSLTFMLGIAGQTATTNSTSNSSATTIIQGNVTTIINASTTTIISGNDTNVIFPAVTGTSDVVTIAAYVQDAVTGQNATRPDGEGPIVESSCDLQPTGFTQCGVDAPFALSVRSGDSYKVTLFVTTGYLPCSLTHVSLCASKLLAPPITFIIPANKGI
jgi:hypothetical protein